MLLSFSYWTYVTMEILRKNVVFFGYWTYMTIDLYDYGLGTIVFFNVKKGQRKKGRDGMKFSRRPSQRF